MVLAMAGASWLTAGPGDGVNINDVMVRPYVAPFAKYESNVLLEEQGKRADTSWGADYGVMLDRALDWYTFSGSLWGMSEDFDKTSAFDHDDFGDTLKLSISTAGGTRIGFNQEFADREEVDYIVGRVEEVLVNRVSAGVGRSVSDKIDVDVAYAFQSHNYDSASLYDWSENQAKGTVGHTLTDKSAGFLSAKIGTQDSDGNRHNGTSYNSILGIRSKSTDKIMVSAGAGLVGLEADEGDIAKLGYEVSAFWQALEKMNVTVNAEKTVQPAVIARSNYLVVDFLSAGISYFILESLEVKLSTDYEYHQLDQPYVQDDGTTVEKRENIRGGALRIEYRCPARWMKMFLEGRSEDQNSSIAGSDYEDRKVLAGMQFQY
jgi:hypothetical protein